MSEPKTVNTSIYKVGTAVWVKVLNRVWWPGIVVDPLTCPQELLDYMRNINYIAVVKFEHEDKYEVVGVNSQIFLYSCERKEEFIERGLSLIKNQKKGMPVVGKFDMINFKNDTIYIERLIGGDIHIFENLEAKQESFKSIVKQFFTPTNTKKSKKKEVDRKSLPVPKLPKTSKTPDQPKPKPVSKPRTSTQSNVCNVYKPSSSTGYSCHSQVGCNFTTNRYDNLKRHMATHKSGTDVVTTKKPSTSSTSNKRKNLKIKLSEVKKQKLQEELLKDWDNDGEEENEKLDASELQKFCSDVAQSSNEEVVQTSEVPSSSNVQSSNEEVVQTSEVPSSSNVQSSNKEVVQTSEVPSSSNVQSSNEEVVQTLSEVISTTSEVLSIENDVIPTISKDIPREREVQETITSNPNQVFDFNENDNNTPVVELRQNKSDFSSSVDDDDVSETFESQITPDFIRNTIFDASPESLLVEKTAEDSVDKYNEINSSNEIDNQTKSTELLLEKTVNTLDQINNFENSLSCISSGINNSDANILTEENNVVIVVSELSECGSLNKIASSYKDIHIETNGIEIKQVENMSTETEDHAIVEENTNDKKIISNDIDVNQLNGATIDKDMPIENSCSEDNTSIKIDFEDKISKKKVCLIDDTPKQEWAKGDDWEDTHKNLKEADFVYHEEMMYIPPTTAELKYIPPMTAELTTNSKSLTERLKFNRESKLEVQPEFILDTKAGFDVFFPLAHDQPYPIKEDFPPDVIPPRVICQKASMENSILRLSFND